MITFIPLQQYSFVVAVILLVFIGTLCLVLSLYPNAVLAHPKNRNKAVVAWGRACFLILLLLIGLRPISYAFGDMGNYYRAFLEYERGAPLASGDPLFEVLLWFFANFLNAPLFFFLCAVLYFVPLIVASRRALKQYWPLAFFFLAAQFDFYGYAVNGLRQGIASSLFLMALTFRGPPAWLIIACSIGFHKSFLLPAIAYGLTWRMTNTKVNLAVWVGALVATSVYAGFGEIVSSSGLGGDKFDTYLNSSDSSFIEQFSATGFRLDFLAYSMIPIAVGYYFLIVKRFEDRFYSRLFNIYLICNAGWLLVIRMPASNRFAYLSWGLMGLVIAYPFVKFKALRGQHVLFSLLLICSYMFTFFSHL